MQKSKSQVCKDIQNSLIANINLILEHDQTNVEKAKSCFGFIGMASRFTDVKDLLATANGKFESHIPSLKESVKVGSIHECIRTFMLEAKDGVPNRIEDAWFKLYTKLERANALGMLEESRYLLETLASWMGENIYLMECVTHLAKKISILYPANDDVMSIFIDGTLECSISTCKTGFYIHKNLNIPLGVVLKELEPNQDQTDILDAIYECDDTQNKALLIVQMIASLSSHQIDHMSQLGLLKDLMLELTQEAQNVLEEEEVSSIEDILISFNGL